MQLLGSFARWLPTVAPFAEFWWSPKEAHPGPLPHSVRCFVRIQEDRTVIETCENDERMAISCNIPPPWNISLWDGFNNRFMSVHVLFHAKKSDKSTRTPFSDEPWPLRPASKSLKIHFSRHRAMITQGQESARRTKPDCYMLLWRFAILCAGSLSRRWFQQWHTTVQGQADSWMSRDESAYSSSVCTKGIQVSRSTFSPGDRRDFFAFSDVSLQRRIIIIILFIVRLMMGKCVVFWGYRNIYHIMLCRLLGLRNPSWHWTPPQSCWPWGSSALSLNPRR